MISLRENINTTSRMSFFVGPRLLTRSRRQLAFQDEKEGQMYLAASRILLEECILRAYCVPSVLVVFALAVRLR